MHTLVVPVHSFVDLITNSSSEIFVSANKGTVTAVKKLVNNLIIAGGGTKTCDELFDIDVAYVCETGSGEEVLLTKSEISAKRKELAANAKKNANPADQYIDDDDCGWYFGDEGDYVKSNIRIVLKDKSNKESAAAAKILGSLTDLFGIDSVYN